MNDQPITAGIIRELATIKDTSKIMSTSILMGKKGRSTVFTEGYVKEPEREQIFEYDKKIKVQTIIWQKHTETQYPTAKAKHKK